MILSHSSFHTKAHSVSTLFEGKSFAKGLAMDVALLYLLCCLAAMLISCSISVLNNSNSTKKTDLTSRVSY